MRAAVVGMLLLCLVSGCTKTVTNSIGMVLIEIPAGKFTMGSPAGEKDHQDDEEHDEKHDEEQVAVTLTKSFWLGKTEVTQGQFRKVMGMAPWKGKEGAQIDKDVVATYVSWEEAKAFCDELTELEQDAGKLQAGEAYRLPTEAEWEYACRAGTTTAFSFEDESKLVEYAWFDEQYAHRVGLKKPNPWGLHDMHGNVMEWCSDWYGEKLSGGTDPAGAEGGSIRVLRGGCWGAAPDYCRSASRDGLVPSDRYSILGFRVARSQSAE